MVVGLGIMISVVILMSLGMLMAPRKGEIWEFILKEHVPNISGVPVYITRKTPFWVEGKLQMCIKDRGRPSVQVRDGNGNLDFAVADETADAGHIIIFWWSVRAIREAQVEDAIITKKLPERYEIPQNQIRKYTY